MHRSRQASGALAVAVLALVAAVAGSAVAGPEDRHATASAKSMRKIALAALRKARHASSKAGAAARLANAARSEGAQASAAAATAQGTAGQALDAAKVAQRAAESAGSAASSANAVAQQAQTAADQATLGHTVANPFCDPSSAAETPCVGMLFHLPRTGRVLMIASGNTLNAAAEGMCRFQINNNTEVGYPGDTIRLNNEEGHFTHAMVTDYVLAAGDNALLLVCNEESGDMIIQDMSFTAVMLSAN